MDPSARPSPARVRAVAALMARLGHPTAVRRAVAGVCDHVADRDDVAAWLDLAWPAALAELDALGEPLPDDTEPPTLDDDSAARWGLLFVCCHGNLPAAARIVLTLALFSGLSTASLARATGVAEATLAQRLSRVESRVRGRVPPVPQDPVALDARLSRVLAVVMAIFEDGRTLPGPDGADLPAEAVGIGRTVVDLFPDHPEARSLLAYMLMVRARRDARQAPDGSLVPLTAQDRSRWRHDEIEEGLFLLRSSRRRGAEGRYHLLARIQSIHVTTDDPRDTDWERILGLYDRLLRRWPSETIMLHRVSALAEVAGPARALAEIERLGGDSHLFHATRADLLVRLGRTEEADRAWTAAVARARAASEHARATGRLEP